MLAETPIRFRFRGPGHLIRNAAVTWTAPPRTLTLTLTPTLTLTQVVSTPLGKKPAKGRKDKSKSAFSWQSLKIFPTQRQKTPKQQQQPQQPETQTLTVNT